MQITINRPYKSIRSLNWVNIPQFAIVTGINGTGKSHLLEALAISFGAFRQNNQPRNHGTGVATITLTEDSFLPGEVFHSDSNWAHYIDGASSNSEISELIQNIYRARGQHTAEGYGQIWQEIASSRGLNEQQIRDLRIDDFYIYLTPAHLVTVNESLNSMNLSLLFLAYAIFQKTAKMHGLDDEKIVAMYGSPPWNLLNEILDASGLPYSVDPPSEIQLGALIFPNQYSIKLNHSTTCSEVRIGDLSSGEKVIISMVFWQYISLRFEKRYKLLLLDEPDAHLHPSMVQRFLDTIRIVFVEGRGVRVILTTHSPTTVALAPADSVFEMSLEEPRIKPAKDRNEIIALLTGNLVIVQENTRIVFLEGKDDIPFFDAVWRILSEKNPALGVGPLSASPNLHFIDGKGKENVKAIVPQLRAKGLRNFYGIIDMDRGNVEGDGVYVLSRNGLENYLVDPINVWHLLNQQSKAPEIPGTPISAARSYAVSKVPQSDIQKAVDAVLDTVRATLNDVVSDDDVLVKVDYTNEKTLLIPRWCLYRDDKAVFESFLNAFSGTWYLKRDKLIESFERLQMIPKDLHDIIEKIQKD